MLIHIIGNLGVGKTTLRKGLTEIFKPKDSIDIDECRSLTENEEDAWLIFQERIKKALSLGDCIIETCGVGYREKDLLTTFQDEGIIQVLLHSEKILGHRGILSQDEVDIALWLSTFYPSTIGLNGKPRETLIIPTDNNTPEDVCKEVYTHIINNKRWMNRK